MITTQNPRPVYPSAAYIIVCFCALIGWRLMPVGPYQPHNWYFYFFGGVFYFCALKTLISGLRGSIHKFKHKRINSKISKRYRPARFATLRDLKKAKMLKPTLNALLIGSLQRRPIFHSGKGHVLTIAKPRTGKNDLMCY